MNYSDLLAIAQTRKRKLSNNTYLSGDGGNTEALSIRLHATDILTFRANGDVELNSGGWKTVTTKARMNEYLPGGWHVRQSKGVWDVARGWNNDGDSFPYVDGMILTADGRVKYPTGKKPGKAGDVTKEAAAHRKAAAKYATAFLDALERGEVPQPSGGDCWFCYLREDKTGRPWGEIAGGKDRHIHEHIKDNYFVPSLLVNATKMFPISPIANDYIARNVIAGEARRAEQKLEAAGVSGATVTVVDTAPSYYDKLAREQVKKSITRYCIRQLGGVT